MGDIAVRGLTDPVRGISEVPRTDGFDFNGVHMQRGIHRFVSVNILAAPQLSGLDPRTPRFRVRGVHACQDCAHRLIRVQDVHPIEEL